MPKPHKGSISNWRKQKFDVARAKEIYGEDPGLGYIISGTPHGHPEFRNWMHTSWIVKHEGNEVETRNSRYTLIGDEYVEQ